MTLDEGHYYIYFLCGDNLWKSKFVSGKAWKSWGILFCYFVTTLVDVSCHVDVQIKYVFLLLVTVSV